MKYNVILKLAVEGHERATFTTIVEADGMAQALSRAGEQLRNKETLADVIGINAWRIREHGQT